MNSLKCSNCSLTNFATASACKRCGLPFDSAAGTEWDSQPYAPSETYPPPTEGGSFFWDQPSYQPSYAPPPMPAASSGKKVIGVFVALAVLSLVAFVAIPKLLKAKTTDFTNLSWSEYRSPDGTFTISLPGTPKETVLNQATVVGNVQVHAIDTEVGKGAGCAVMHADYPILKNVSEETLYDQTLKAMAGRADAIGARRYITHDGRKGIEVELKPRALRSTEATGIARLFWTAPRLYIVLTSGPDTAEFKAVQTRCLDSFRFSGGR